MPALQIVHPAIDSETVETLERLLADAKIGRVVGLAYVALHNGPDYSAEIVGEAAAHPLLARGIASALADSVAVHPRRK